MPVNKFKTRDKRWFTTKKNNNTSLRPHLTKTDKDDERDGVRVAGQHALHGCISVAEREEHRTAFFGEDIHIDIPPGDVGEVVFTPRTNRSSQVVLLRSGVVADQRGRLNSFGHLVLEDVQEEDEGVYVVSKSSHPLKRLVLIVRDCAVEQVVKYGDTYYIHLNQVQGPIRLEFRPGPVLHINYSDPLHATEPPAVLLYPPVLADAYAGRLSVSEKSLALHSVKKADEGSFTVLDFEGKVRRRNCLHVREHQDFLRPSNGDDVVMKLYLPHSHVNVVYRPKAAQQGRLVLEQGVLVTAQDPQLEGRLNAEGSALVLKKVRVSDAGVFKVTDLAGFPVAHIYVDVVASQLPPLTVAVMSMLSLIAAMLLLCLLSCLYKVHKRNKKNKKLMLLAQQASKRDGETFRQTQRGQLVTPLRSVVQEAYTKFTEESAVQSACDNPSDATEVVIKGLEVSKPGRYQALTSEVNFLEMSDSGVEFTSSGLPLDSDTDAVTCASHKPLLSAYSPGHRDSQEATLATLSAARTPDSATIASPAASGNHSFAVASPETPPVGGAGSAETAGAAEDGEEASRKEEVAQST
ncbi:uncharacterized protein LOC133552154 [Nerophis ophidion]|uniref:uncharacterized protein LOC133552154 n=1 Tax=Nerophis ophidion TaxID=159077 RepID=UPI002ADFEA34|nr:uncharacterized protein LOC133552154 [Nerophis ophidion]